MTRDEVITRCCAIVGMAYNSIGDYSEPSDCFCPTPVNDSPFVADARLYFQHSGVALDYIEAAVREKLQRDGYLIAEPIAEEKP